MAEDKNQTPAPPAAAPDALTVLQNRINDVEQLIRGVQQELKNTPRLQREDLDAELAKLREELAGLRKAKAEAGNAGSSQEGGSGVLGGVRSLSIFPDE